MWGVWSYAECNCTNIMHAHWVSSHQIGYSVHVAYAECMNLFLGTFTWCDFFVGCSWTVLITNVTVGSLVGALIRRGNAMLHNGITGTGQTEMTSNLLLVGDKASTYCRILKGALPDTIRDLPLCPESTVRERCPRLIAISYITLCTFGYIRIWNLRKMHLFLVCKATGYPCYPSNHWQPTSVCCTIRYSPWEVS